PCKTPSSATPRKRAGPICPPTRPCACGPVLHPVLVQQLQKLKPGTVDQRRAEDVARALCRIRPNIEGNLAAWEYLKGLRTVFVETERRGRHLRLTPFPPPPPTPF